MKEEDRTINHNLFKGPFPILETRRLVLREFSEKDAERILSMRSNGRISEFIARPRMDSQNDALDLAKNSREAFYKATGIAWAGELKSGGDLIGGCGLNHIDTTNLRAEIGGELDTHQWGRGIAAEALQVIIEFGFKELGLHSIEAKVNPANRPATTLLRQFGFVQEAYFKDRIHFHGKFLPMAIYTLFEP